jgi:hypothetical protein
MLVLDECVRLNGSFESKNAEGEYAGLEITLFNAIKFAKLQKEQP